MLSVVLVPGKGVAVTTSIPVDPVAKLSEAEVVAVPVVAPESGAEVVAILGEDALVDAAVTVADADPDGATVSLTDVADVVTASGLVANDKTVGAIVPVLAKDEGASVFTVGVASVSLVDAEGAIVVVSGLIPDDEGEGATVAELKEDGDATVGVVTNSGLSPPPEIAID